MLDRVLELWERVPGRGASGSAPTTSRVLEAAIRAAELAGEFERGVCLAKAALREIDTAPTRSAPRSCC